MIWAESKAGRRGEEIASAILKWADNVIPYYDVDEITIWYDNCYGQNKNIFVVLLLDYLKISSNKMCQHKISFERAHPYGSRYHSCVN